MKERSFADVMAKYQLPRLQEGAPVIRFQTDQAAYFLSKMRTHEAQFQQAFVSEDERAVRKQRERYIYNFSAYLSASRIAVFFLISRCRLSSAGRTWVDEHTRTQPFRAFKALRDVNTHRSPLHFSLSYRTYGEVTIPMRGIIPSKVTLNIFPHLKVSEPPLISVDLNAIESPLKTELVLYVRDDERRQSLTFMCSEFLEELEAVLTLAVSLGYL